MAGGAVVVSGGAGPVTAAEATPSDFLIEGELEQGGWIRGKAPPRTLRLRLGNTALPLDNEGRFFAAFDRDAALSAELVATLSDGGANSAPITVAPRDWQIERVNIARKPGGMSEAFWKIREPELKRIEAARSVGADSRGWAQKFIWPVKGRISGRFGSQRIYRGEPGAYHSGLDIATGASGTPFVAPADGVVTLAATTPFSLEGYLLIIDHGNGLNSAFLHCSDILVREGDVVTQGQTIGKIGATGRATGPHLHWSMKWNDARLDPLLFTGPMN
ncbi:M23 family metallopeptidase [Erythrobacter sp. SDW2]|nr:M23 family metallopeptidase [Erythrobacter sp. SDW2]UIP07253.1 M23 family metallopeptidase [Erythrobacter sp. SDW2]